MKKIITKLLRESGDYSNKEHIKDKIVERLIGEVVSIMHEIDYDDLQDILTKVYENSEFLFMDDDSYLSEQRLIESYYDSDKLYSKSYIQQRLINAPKYVKTYLSQLEEIECINKKGENNICVKIPEVIHVFLFGSSF